MDKWGSRTDAYMKKIVMRLEPSKWDEVMDELDSPPPNEDNEPQSDDSAFDSDFDTFSINGSVGHDEY